MRRRPRLSFLALIPAFVAVVLPIAAAVGVGAQVKGAGGARRVIEQVLDEKGITINGVFIDQSWLDKSAAARARLAG